MSRILIIVLAGLIAVSPLGGCGGDPANPSTNGSVSVAVAPSSLSATWLLVGPDDYSYAGVGSEQLRDLSPGEYFLSWGTVSDWLTPAPALATGTLSAGGELGFEGRYLRGATIAVEPAPEELQPAWELSGPEGWRRDGSGRQTFEELTPGTYSLTWTPALGYDTPVPAVLQHDLFEGEQHVFQGEYGERPGTLVFGAGPVDLAPVWTLTDPEGAVSSGTVGATLTDIPAGDYLVSWQAIPGWLTPGPERITVPSGLEVVHEVVYQPTSLRVIAPAGDFMMGGPDDEPGSEPDEFPQHRVTFTRAFQIGTTEVTNAQFIALAQWAYDRGLADCDGLLLREAESGSRVLLELDDETCEIGFMNDEFHLRDVGWGLNPDHPVNHVTWYGAARFCDWMNDFEGHPRSYDEEWLCNDHDPYGAGGYRLPTEAEWEYACRSGTSSAFYGGEITNTTCDEPVLDPIGWYCGNSEIRLHPVAQLAPSPWGIYDMHGNVFEWVNDVVTPRYESANVVDPVGPREGASRVTRGGTSFYSVLFKALNCRSANRSSGTASLGLKHIGFRIVRTVGR